MAKKIQDENGNTYVAVKPWYKKWWVWVIAIIVVIFLFAMFGGSDSDSSSSSSNTSSSNTSSTAKSSSKKKQTVEKNTAKAVTLGAGTYKVGRDIQPGRYVIRAKSGSGNVSGDNDLNLILGTTVDNDLGQVDSYTTDLKKNAEVKLESLQSVTFTPTPAKRSFKTTLSAGDWVVGKDIKAGRYEITALQGSGNLTTDDGDLNEILGTTSDKDSGQVTKVNVDLSNGQVLNNALESIKLTAK
ncbi:hypothetical protein [Lactiplantibacillus plantarum]|uniref:hypothetical protein n=1 Tax=Lactiplantibacillus plantarum TaxID=1590 RepID=UPI002349C93E|nr:hypothetical protein [Lactiplantibacillus plantarum]MCG0557206.1 phage immunity protein [Lactiplantibacillus plantarum]MCG0817145.1 phage immunity protein [Lactiplantibacillus plantarum]MCG0820149.1 phage immunity protein [Lactiplantibacillus plantarum]MCG0822796.1 phage immunity protein [Lactiplantibacillus plantarum]MCG0842242.1 phage immunity protein [Lactiplantibacillus plantarum]